MGIDPPKPQRGTPTQTYDVIVAGAGPAGSTLARELASQGARVTLLEHGRKRPPKLCGGGLSLKTLRLLPFDLSPVLHCTVQRLALLHHDRESLVIGDGQPLLATTLREQFDLFLAEQARLQGAALLEDRAVRGVVDTGGWYEVQTQDGLFKCRVLVGADGANSLVAHSLGLRRDPFLLLALEGEVPVGELSFAPQEDTALVDWGGVRNGYGWLFPKRGQVTLGVGAPPRRSKQLKRYYRDLLGRFVADLSSQPPPRGHHLPVRKLGMPIQRGRALLVGDAAGLVEPFTGEGIYYAIRSAQLAAGEILRLLNDERTDLGEYERRIDAELMPEILAGQVLSGLFGSFPGLALGLFGSSQEVKSYFCRAIRGEANLADCGPALGAARPLFDLARWLAIRDNRLNVFGIASG